MSGIDMNGDMEVTTIEPGVWYDVNWQGRTVRSPNQSSPSLDTRDLRDGETGFPNPGGRDLRDPQKLGELILRENTKAKNVLSVADWAEREEIPDYSHEESMVSVTQREYREELEARIAEGDKYAKSALERIENEGS